MSTATVTVLPAYKIVVARRLPLEKREEILEDLAREIGARDPEEITFLLSWLASDELTGRRLELAWRDFCERLVLRDARRMRLDSGPDDSDPEQDFDDALDVLTGKQLMRWHA